MTTRAEIHRTAKVMSNLLSGVAAETKWLLFKWAPEQNPKTEIYLVLAKDGNAELGQVRWHAQWRRYAFFPRPDTVYEPTCLRDLAEFCDKATAAHKAKKL